MLGSFGGLSPLKVLLESVCRGYDGEKQCKCRQKPDDPWSSLAILSEDVYCSGSGGASRVGGDHGELTELPF